MSSRTVKLVLVLGVLITAACSAQPIGPEGSRGNADGATSSAGGGVPGGAGTSPLAGAPSVGGTSSGGMSSGGMSSGGVGGAPTTKDPCQPRDSQKLLPVAVDGPFIPGGYFAGPEDPSPNLEGITDSACEQRPEAAVHYGSCHRFSFKASVLESAPVQGQAAAAYGGVFWLAGSESNWGTAPGVNVQPGATRVKFKAWGAIGGEVVTFNVGGVTGPVCLDDVSFGTAGGMTETLTTTPTEYSFDLRGQTYPSGVIGGFAWSTKTTSTDTTTTFYLDDIRWTSDAE